MASAISCCYYYVFMRVFVSFLSVWKHISNPTVILESGRFELNFFFLSHARLIFFPVIGPYSRLPPRQEITLTPLYFLFEINRDNGTVKKGHIEPPLKLYIINWLA